MLLATNYLGLTLKSPLVASASPLNSKLDNLRRLEDAGAAAIVLPSLFQEQIEAEAEIQASRVDAYTNSSPEALSYFPMADSGPVRGTPGTLSGSGPPRDRGGLHSHHRQPERFVPCRLDRICTACRAGWREGAGAEHVSRSDRSA